MAWIPAGRFRMGSTRHYPDEAPVHERELAGFFIDRHAVTNEEFARFVTQTGYVTLCEKPPDGALYPEADPTLLVPGSGVFRKPERPVSLRNPAAWWVYVPGASWRAPEGPGSTIAGRERHPVVHVAYEDALAYAHWAGKALPSEAEWERAARGGLDGADYCWGDQLAPGGRMMANYWQGDFPWENQVLDGFEGTAPVGSFEPNGFGLYDMAGNVWEWTRDDYTASHHQGACCAPERARAAERFPRRVLKGGSFLCSANYCFRYRPAARYPQTVDTSTCHIGFRCVVRP